MFTKKDELSPAQSFELLQNEADFSIKPFDHDPDLEDNNKFKRMKLNTAQKVQLSALVQQIPGAMAAGTLAKAYIVEFPAGLPHSLTLLSQGGFGSMIRTGGKFAGTASLFATSAQATALSAFTVMSAVTGQYFLASINSEIKLVNNKLDEIINFLYGDKKAELLAEIGFVKYAHANFESIIMHEQQRLATITSLQEARKVAMKDIEFYLETLDTMAKEEVKDYKGIYNEKKEAFKYKDCIEMSRQLYVVSGLLELFYAQNYDESFVHYLEDDLISCVNKCDRRIMSSLSIIQGKIANYKAKPLEKVEDKTKLLLEIDNTLTTYKDEKDSPLRVSIKETIDSIDRKAVYYLDESGQVFIKNGD